MPNSQAHDLHGSAPDHARTALLIIDFINDFVFPEASELLPFAEPAALQTALLAERAREAHVPVIYVNDNFGRWRSDFKSLIAHCTEQKQAAAIVKRLVPQESDYFVLKPKHSGFFSTTLNILLEYLGVQNVLITGIAGNICVLFTANDAYMRDLKLFVPSDCVASNSQELNDYALKQMQTVLKACTDRSERFSVEVLSELGRGGSF